MKLLAIDPWGCGCTECLIGEYKPLNYATDDDIADLLSGRLRSHLNSDEELEVSVQYKSVRNSNWRMVLRVESVKVSYMKWNGQELTWEPDPYRAGLIK